LLAKATIGAWVAGDRRVDVDTTGYRGVPLNILADPDISQSNCLAIAAATIAKVEAAIAAFIARQ
jgi:hypothetical protein